MTVADLLTEPAPGTDAGPDRGPGLIGRVRRGVIGDDEVLVGPFGPRRLTYADWTASGRSLGFIEDAVRDRVLPRYANTHTESSGAGRHTTRLREQARQTIHRAVEGTDRDLVISTGSGATGAAAKLVRNPVPTVPGGGTIVFVDPVGQRYLDDPVAGRRAGPRRPSSRSGPGWSWPPSRPSGPT